MAKEHIEINYVFRFEDQKDMRFGVTLDPTTSTIVRDAEEPTPQWAKLEHHQCPNCPLENASCSYCPVASNMASVVKNCNEIISHKSLELEVVTPERTISTKTTAQRALSSLLGLVIATSDCPHTRFFRPMARFHLPMASQEETVFRVVSTYCLASYFRMQSEPVLGLGTLHDIYTNMQTVNEHLAKRLQDCSDGDATKNAVVLLHLLSCVLPISLEESLEKLRPLFRDLMATEKDDAA